MNYVMIYRWATIAIAVNCLFRDLKANTNHQAINCINMEILARGPLCTLIESLKHLCQHLTPPLSQLLPNVFLPSFGLQVVLARIDSGVFMRILVVLVHQIPF